MSAEPINLGGINNKRSEEAPLTTVISDMKTLNHNQTLLIYMCKVSSVKET